jgi:hypothetical protein
MPRLLLFTLLAVALGSAHAAAYPLGTMTCDDIATFASEAMQWRTDGKTRDEAMAELEKRSFKDPVEKKNLAEVIRLVFGSYGDNWTVESAGTVLRTDCLTGR